MPAKTILKQLDQQMQALSPDITLVLLHPFHNLSHRHLAYRLLHGATMVYIQLSSHFSGYHASAPALHQLLAMEMKKQAGMSLPKLDKTPRKAAAQIAQAVNQTKELAVFLADYDSIEDPAADEFIRVLAQQLQPKHRVIISGRGFPMGLLNQAENNSYSTMIPNNQDFMLIDHARRPDHQAILEIRSLGPGQGILNGHLLTTWDGVLPKSLFFYLVNRGLAVRDEIFATFWDGMKKEDATNVFHVTKRKINEILGEDLTLYSNGFYRISDHIKLYYDVALFQNAVQTAAVIDDEDQAITLYQQAKHLYRGAFLSTFTQDWINVRRDELQNYYIEALVGLARIYHKRRLLPEALTHYLRALANSELREDLFRETMGVYRDSGQPQQAIELYKLLARELDNKFGIKPSPETIRLAEEIKQQR